MPCPNLAAPAQGNLQLSDLPNTSFMAFSLHTFLPDPPLLIPVISLLSPPIQHSLSLVLGQSTEKHN